GSWASRLRAGTGGRSREPRGIAGVHLGLDSSRYLKFPRVTNKSLFIKYYCTLGEFQALPGAPEFPPVTLKTQTGALGVAGSNPVVRPICPPRSDRAPLQALEAAYNAALNSAAGGKA